MRARETAGKRGIALAGAVALIWATAAASTAVAERGRKATVDDSSPGFWAAVEPARIAALETSRDDRGVVVRFTTAAEHGTVGYSLYRFEPETGELAAVHHALLPAALGGPLGGSYEVRDDDAPSSGPLAYTVVAVAADGSETIHGPFRSEPVASSAAEPLWEEARSKRRGRDRDGDSDANSDSDSDSDGSGRTRPRPARKGRPGGFATWDDQRLRIEVSEDGLYFLGAEEIAAATGLDAQGIARAITRARLELSVGGQAVAWMPAELGSGLYFYGQTAASCYTSTNVYWLEPGAGRLMEIVDGTAGASAELTASPTTRHFEVDAMPVTFLGSASPDDFYYWSYLSAGHQVYGSAVHEFELDQATVLSGAAALEIALQGASSTPVAPEHLAELRLNGTLIGNASWDGALPHRELLEFPAELLQAGVNELEVTGIRLPGVAYSVFLVDDFSVTFGRRHEAIADALTFQAVAGQAVTAGPFSSAEVTALEISDPLSPRWVVNQAVSPVAGGFTVTLADGGSHYLAAGPSAVRSVDSLALGPQSMLAPETVEAEYLVLAPGALSRAADSLAGYRRDQGLSARLVVLEEVYDAYGHGLPSPEAIRTFLADAYATWETAPRFVALVGSASFDYRDVEGEGRNLLPTFMQSTPYGFYASDLGYADLVGDDAVPEIAVGRIPARDDAELAAYVAKLYASERFATGVEPDDLILLADNADGGGNYPIDSESLALALPPAMNIERLYLSQQHVSQARRNLAQALADGASWVNYMGHGTIDRFAAEALLTAADVPTIQIVGRLPVVSAMTCSVGRFEVPGWRSLAEALVLAPEGGAMAMVAPSGQSLHFEARLLNEGLFEAVFGGNAATVGEAAVEALGHYAAVGHLEFLPRIYNLLGDPAVRIR